EYASMTTGIRRRARCDTQLTNSTVESGSSILANSTCVPASVFTTTAITTAVRSGSISKPIAVIRSSGARSEEHTSELQSRFDLVCRLLLEKKKKQESTHTPLYNSPMQASSSQRRPTHI